MLVSAGIVMFELLILFLISREFTKQTFLIVLLLFRKRSIGVTLISLILFPGTVIHELSHLFTAEILRVRTGKLTLVPENITGENIQSGSVAISSTDPFRRALIGLAPVFVGIIALFVLNMFLSPWLADAIRSIQNGIYIDFLTIRVVLLIYAIFAISTTMFSSPQDLKGVWPLFVVIALLWAGGYIAGFQIVLPGWLTTPISRMLMTLAKSLGIVVSINAAGTLLSYLLIRGLEKLFHVRINTQ